MTKKENVTRHLTSALITIIAAAVVIWLRSGTEAANMIMRLEVSGITFSTTDLFVIIAAGLCGYRYGSLIFLGVLAAQLIQGGGHASGVFSVLIYLLIAIISGVFAEKRWYRSIWKTFLVLMDFVILLGGSWYIMFAQVNRSQTFYGSMSLPELCISAMPESVVAVLILFIFFNCAPDTLKKKVGIAYLYTSEYEQSEDFRNSRHSVLKKQITVMSMAEALLLGVFVLVISNSQITALTENQRYLMSERRFGPDNYTFSEMISGDTESVSAADDTAGTDGEVLSSDQIQQISDDIVPDERYLFIMNLQLALFVISIAIPLGMFFSDLIVREVVLPIKTLSAEMTSYFSADEEERQKFSEKFSKYRLSGKYNEISELQNSMQRMISDMSNYIERSKKEHAGRETAEARSEAKSEFLSNMSHEIRTPINAVLGMNEMILRESSDDNITEYAENIRNAGNTLLGLVNDILDFSKIEAGKMDIIPVDYDLASVLNDLVMMIQTRAEAKGLELIVKVDSEIPDFLHGDEIRLKQIVTNILTNAVKYTEKGSVTIDVGYEKTDKANIIGLRFSISDTGIGIKSEDMDKLFAAFERIDEERNRTIEGTGLGMNITRRLLSMMGSRLEVQSEYGKGSTFAFTVEQTVVDLTPIGDYEKSYRNTLAGRKKYKEKFTAPEGEILVVDDTKMNLTVFRSLLKKTGLNIDTAASGDECLKMAAEKKYDVIFLDHRMPVKDGIETLHELRGMSGTPNTDTPTVCLTANAVSGARETYLAAGFDDYLTKPIDPDHLEAALLKYLPEEKIQHTDKTEESAGTIEQKPFPEWLTELSGNIDVTEGIKHCGDAEIYTETLRTYAECINDNADEIERLWKEHDIAGYTVKVHALKSTSWVIGAMKLGDLAELLEKAGDAGDTALIGSRTDELLSEYRSLGTALSPLIKPEHSGELPEIPTDKLYEAYGAVRELAEVFDYESVTFIMDSLSEYSIPENERARYNELKKAVSKPDWDMIKSVLSD